MKRHGTVMLGALVMGIVACGSEVDDVTSGATVTSSATGSAQGSVGNGTGGSASTSTMSTTGAAQGGSSQGGASQAGAGPGGSAQGGAGSCLGCSDILQGGDAAEACTMNGPPSSSELWDVFSTCLCVDHCSLECASTCNGGMPDGACQQCGGMNCLPEFQACATDGGMMACETCASVVQGGDPDNLCPGSQPLFQALTDCTCVNSCAMECGDNVCMGGMIDGACQACVGQSCGAELAACFMDN